MKVCLIGDLTGATAMQNMIIFYIYIYRRLSKTVVKIHLSTILAKNKSPLYLGPRTDFVAYT